MSARIPDIGTLAKLPLSEYLEQRPLYAVANGIDPLQVDERVQSVSALVGDITTGPPDISEMNLSDAELESAKLHPDCIVQEYLFADVSIVPAPGSTGKTTLMLYEAVCIALNRPLYGLEVKKQGWFLMVTAEDRREYLAARLREIMKTMDLSFDDRLKVYRCIRIWDVTGEPVKLASCFDGNIGLTPLADDIIAKYSPDPPMVVLFDPVVSFGASEAMINDNEQALITAARRIVRAFNCCVRFIAHTGKQAARDKQLDQYASRGGSALADGSRMVTVMQTWTDECGKIPPPGCTPDPDSSITILARAKLSYAKPNLPLIWIKRTGFAFEYFIDNPLSKEEKSEATLNQLEQFLKAEIAQGRKHSRTSLEAAITNYMPRKDYRPAIDLLIAHGRVVERELPKAERVTRRKTYLALAEFGGIPKNSGNGQVINLLVNNAAALRENNGGIIPAAHFPPDSNAAENTRQDSAGLAELDYQSPFIDPRKNE
ncbi:MAG: AAA family ATPase [Gammaproteobacteria bacterium]|nr:AAA family ATPase [Gammaproteobacteria bacterium]